MVSGVHRGRRGRVIGRASAIIVAGLFAQSVSALEFELDNGTRVLWGTNVSAGAMWRAGNPRGNIISNHNASNGTGNPAQDDGDLNYKRGDMVSAPIRVISDVEVRKGDTGVLVRAKAWYDYAQENKGVAHGNYGNGYEAGKPLSDDGFNAFGRFKGIQLLDAYGYTRFNLGEDHPVDLRIGRQVINWGESLFYLGANQVNPIDVIALHKPGLQLKEVFLPVEMAYANVGLAAGTSLEAFYQFKWHPFVVDGCGTYFSQVDIGLDPGCKALTNGVMPPWYDLDQSKLSPLMNDKAFMDMGFKLGRLPDNQPKNGGQWGLALRTKVEPIDSEVGFYYERIASRLPVISATSVRSLTDPKTLAAITANTATCNSYATAHGYDPTYCNATGSNVAGGLGIGAVSGLFGTANYFFEYPEGMKVLGASLATNIFGWSMGFELNQTRDFPVQLNPPDILVAAALQDGPLGSRLRDASGTPCYSSDAGNCVLHGYDRKTKTSFDINGVQILNAGTMGASNGLLVAEFAIQHVDIADPNKTGNPRYGRGFHWWYNSTTNPSAALSGGASCQTDGMSSGNTGEICTNNGYYSKWAYGYRLMGTLAYNLSSGVTLKPTVFWAHDIKGTSVDFQMVDKRKQLGLTMRAEYEARYFGEVGYTTWHLGSSAPYDQGGDRDFYSALVGMTF